MNIFCLIAHVQTYPPPGVGRYLGGEVAGGPHEVSQDQSHYFHLWWVELLSPTGHQRNIQVSVLFSSKPRHKPNSVCTSCRGHSQLTANAWVSSCHEVEQQHCVSQISTAMIVYLSSKSLKCEGVQFYIQVQYCFVMLGGSIFPVNHIILSSAPFALSETSYILVAVPLR